MDYHGLPVLPMTLRQGVRLSFRPRSDRRVVLRNADPSFPERDFGVSRDLVPGPAGDWGNYAMAAALAVLRAYGVERGIEGEVSSDLPVAAGLSSSSALVVAVALALLDAGDVEVPYLDLAEVLAEGERFVGTAGGGMDQAASLAGRPGCVLRIAFQPLAVHSVPVPEGWTILVAHSGVRAEKSGRARRAYNERRSASAEALEELARRWDVPGLSPRGLMARFPVHELLAECRRLPAPGGPWAAHVLSEARRVEQAVAALHQGALSAFGQALVASHESLRDVFKVSHPALDALVAGAMEAGAAGARLTGAGFGGCVVAVCAADRTEAVREGLRRAQPAGTLPPFEAEAGPGARVTA